MGAWQRFEGRTNDGDAAWTLSKGCGRESLAGLANQLRRSGGVQFLASLRDRIRKGEITCTVRLWQRSHVKVGGRYPLQPGHVVVTNVFEIGISDITPDLARRSGFAGVVDLLKIAKHGPGRRVYLIEFRYEDPGPRVRQS